MIKFRDYSKYPVTIMSAARFRDEYDDLPDGAYFAIAKSQGLYNALIKLAEWEHENTDTGKVKKDE